MSHTEKIEAKATHHFKSSQEAVFDAWVDPDLIRQWQAIIVPGRGMGEVKHVETHPHPGGNFIFTDMRAEGEAYHHGIYREVHRPHKLVFTWIAGHEEDLDPSVVSIIILPHPDGGAAVTLTHEMDPQWADYVGRTEKGWGVMLTQIEELLDKRM
jgi:uncharacterized protein YndB with AHSA1/START domain